MKTTDVELIHRVLDGDDTAFTVLVKKYQKQVHALAWRKIGDFHIAEKITQDTFLKAYQELATLKKPQSFASWLYVIAANNCSTWLRKKRLRTEPLEDTRLQKATYSQYVVAENERVTVEAQREAVKQLLAKLQESERTVVTLHYFGEMSSAEIGAFLGVSANTVRSRLRRAQQRLKKEEPMIREALENFQITPNLTENIMQEIARLKPMTPSGSKPLVPWAIAASTIAVVLLMLGIGNQHLSRFQKPYSFDATSEMTVEIIEAPVVLDLESKPDVRTQLGSSTTPSRNDGSGQQPDDVLFAAAQAEGEDVSIPKQQWIQAEPVKGSDVDALSVSSNGELYTVANKHIYKMESDGKEWEQITDIDALGVKYGSTAFIEKWNDTLYLLVDATFLASKDDGKTWELVHTLPVDSFALDLILTNQAFYIVFSHLSAFRSEDMGKTWQAMNVGFPENPKAIVVIQDTLFAGTYNGLYRSEDDNWQRVKLPVRVGEILSIATAEGKIYVAAQFSKDVTNSQKVRQGQARGWWIFRSTDLGDSWDDITPTNAWQVMGVPPEIKLVATGETLLAMERGMILSTDSGNTWLPPQLPGTSPSMDNRLNSAAIVNDSTIYVRSKKDGLYRSTDGGISWDTVNIVNLQNWEIINNLIAYRGGDNGQNIPPTLYAIFEGDIVKTTDKGKSWRALQMGTPMTAPVREEPPFFNRIGEFGGSLYAKTDGWRSFGNEYKTGLYRISADGNTVMPIQGMPIFNSSRLNYLWKNGRKGSLDVSDKSFIEQLKENFVGADKFFKTLARGETHTQDELYREQLYQEQERLILNGLLFNTFAVSGDTFYLEYNFKLFRWRPGETEWSDTGVQETGELLYMEAAQAFESAGLPKEKIIEIFRTWHRGFKLAVSGNTVYVGKRDGHLVASFDMGNNWLDLTPALPFPVKAFKTIVFVGSTVYVATDAGVAASDDGKQWRAMTDAAGKRLNMAELTVDGDTLYGLTRNTGIYRLENGTWEQIVSQVPDSVTSAVEISLAVDGNTLYVNSGYSDMLHFNLEE